MVWWPVGLMVLAFIIGRGRMGCGYHGDRWQRKMERLQDKMERLRGRGDWWGCHSSSGNRLRQAKDKAEFDQFMAERRNRPPEQLLSRSEPRRP
jgi:hypothetical protein